MASLVVVALILAVGCSGGGSTIHRQPHPDINGETIDAFLSAVDDGRYGDLHSTLIIIDGLRCSRRTSTVTELTNGHLCIR